VGQVIIARALVVSMARRARQREAARAARHPSSF
jgi:hypothetical protein